MKSHNPVLPGQWSKPKRIKSPTIRWVLIIASLLYLGLGIQSFEIDVPRIIFGLERGAHMLSGFLRPDFASRGSYIVQGILESIAMTLTATTIGVILAFPLSLGASKNISPLPIYMLSRVILVIFRSLHVVILAVLFVIMFGFGPFAGMLVLVINSIGFMGKLLAEDIEGISHETLEAIRATGASWPQVVVYGVWPQVANRFVGLTIYRADQSFRQSTVIGLVGAGGIGAVLNTAMGRYDYSTAGAILLVIIVFVLFGEYVSSSIRRRLT